MTTVAAPWWVRPGLEIVDGRLAIAGQDAEALAREHGTPLFVYDRQRFAENARRLQAAYAGAGLPYRVRFALTRRPKTEILEVLRARIDNPTDVELETALDELVAIAEDRWRRG